MQYQLKQLKRNLYSQSKDNNNENIDVQDSSPLNNISNNSFHSFIRESIANFQNFQKFSSHLQFDGDTGSQSYFEQKRINKNLAKKNFITCFQQETIIQYYNAYLPVMEFLPYLQKIEKIYYFYHRKVFKRNHDTIVALPIPNYTQNQLDQLVIAIRQIMYVSQKKYEAFLKFKLAAILNDWKLLVNLLTEISDHGEEEIEIRTQQRCQRRHYIKQIIKVIYTNIRYIIDFIQLNQQTFYFLRKDLTKYLMPRMKYIKRQQQERTNHNHFANRGRFRSQIIRDQTYGISKPELGRRLTKQKKVGLDVILQHIQQKQDRSDQSEEETTQTYIAKLFYIMNTDQISNCYFKDIFYTSERSLKSLYSALVYHNEEKTHKLEFYSTISKKVQSHKNHFLMGLFIGLGSITLFALLVLLSSDVVSFDYDQTQVDSMIYVFPMFRGMGLLIMYLWGMAWNVYGYTTFRINHRLILEYGAHYSTHFQIMKRAGFFTLIFSSMLLLYCVLETLTIYEVMTEDENLVEYTPFVVWVLFFSYIFFPNRDVFNPKGRRYFYDLLKKIVQSPFTKITFLITWASDQAVSFVIPFKDFSYTICFYTSDINLQSVKKCLNASHIQGVLVTYVVAILPLILRMIQCYRLAMQQNGQFKGHIQYYNFFKYCSSVLTATLSYLSTIQSKFFILFVISSIFSTCFSYYWDLKHDWGFFEKNSKHKFLRNHLSYKSPIFYYVAIAVNFIFRCAWTLTISPSVVEYFHKSTFLPFLTGSLEICRRCMWNFIRVQKEHLVNCQDYVIMKPDVEKLIQKFKGKDRPSKIQAFESNQQAYLGYNQKLKQSFVDQIKRDLNLAYYFGQQQYQRQWAEINPAKVSLRKTQYLNLRQKQKNLFYQTKDTIKYDEDLLQSIY